MNRKFRIGMIGGGKGSFIGAVHRMALQLDGMAILTAGAFSSRPEIALESGKELLIANDRIYTDFKTMLNTEAQLPTDKKIEVVSIVTPNHVHFEPAKMALELGFHVILEKPATFNLEEAKQLHEISLSTGKKLLLCHTYTGYPMVKEAKKLIASGILGNIRKVYAEYPQGWLSTFLEKENNAQAAWRTDPTKSGAAGAMGDIGTHVFNLAEYVSGLKVTKICADINTVINGRLLDDDGAALVKFDNGSSGVFSATQIAAGEENNIKIKIHGEKGSIEWQQENANSLLVKWLDAPTQIYRTAAGYNTALSNANTRTPSGHPEGYLEAFANLYRNFLQYIDAIENNTEIKEAWQDFPSTTEAVRGMQFIERMIESGKSEIKWLNF